MLSVTLKQILIKQTIYCIHWLINSNLSENKSPFLLLLRKMISENPNKRKEVSQRESFLKLSEHVVYHS